MKILLKALVLLLALLHFSIVMANENITGTWEGKLSTGPNMEMTVQFVINQAPDGSYDVLLNSPDRSGIHNIKASSVVFSDNRLKLDVTELSGSYEGILKGGEIKGHWKQEGTSYPLDLSPSRKAHLSVEVMEKLLGKWHGDIPTLTGPVGPAYSFKFEISDQGDLIGFLDDQRGGDPVPLSDIEMADDGTFSFRMPGGQSAYKGKLGENKIIGEIQLQSGMWYPQVLEKGEYVEKERINTLTKDALAMLIGEWNGKIGSTEISFQFEQTGGEFDIMGFVRIPDQGITEMPFTGSNYNDGDLTLEAEFINAEFNGKLSENKLEGEWVQDGKSDPIKMIKEIL